MNAQEQSTYEVIDGYVIDPETGEVIGLATPPAFIINNPQGLDWAMEMMLKEAAAIHEIDNTAIVVQARAILENAAKMKADRAKRLAWLHVRFDNEIGNYVKPLLEGQKTKTYKTLYGSVSFRSVKGGLRVGDVDKALEWASANCPQAIQTKAEFRISNVPDSIKAAITASPTGLEREAFLVQPDEERLKVETRVEGDAR